MIADLLLAANFVFQKKYQKTAFDGLSYMLRLIGAESLSASVLYPFITGGSIILTSFAGMAVLKKNSQFYNGWLLRCALSGHYYFYRREKI